MLATKVRVPPRPVYTVRRDRLTRTLEDEIPRHKLAVVTAPAGYGKTTLLSQWASTTATPVGWVSLEDDDNDLDRFLRYVVAAWNDVQPGLSDSPLGWLVGSMFPDREAVLSEFINQASRIDGHVVLVLDDFHDITDSAIHDALTFLIDHLPTSLHFAVSGRAAPPLPLARYRARGELFELGAGDLTFQPEESSEFLTSSMGLDLSPEQISALHEQLEGWAAGLQLASLGLRRASDPTESTRIVGRHRYIADYLAEDVLDRLDEEVRRFLLQTSILDTLTEPLCDAVTGETNARAMLSVLERENLFLVPLDERREWFRYHRVFADFLREERRRRSADDAGLLHSRAGAWYFAHDVPEAAFRHAVDGGDVELAVAIFDRYANAKLNAGELKLVGEWLSLLPDEWRAAYPAFDLARAGLLAFSGDMAGCIRCIEEIEAQLETHVPESARWQMARVNAVRCFIACIQNDVATAEDLAEIALRELSDDDLGFRPGIYGALGDVYRQNGRWEDAYASYRKVFDYMSSPGVRLQAAHVYGALADLELRQGRLTNAAANWRQALTALASEAGASRLPLPVIGWIHIRLAEILYEWNQLSESRSYVTAGLDRVELGGDVRSMIAGYILAGRLDLAEGNVEAALSHLERVRPFVAEATFPEWTSRFERFQLELWLAKDHLRAAVNWVDEHLQDDVLRGRPEREITELAIARALVMKGDMVSIQRALVLLDDLFRWAEQERRTGVTVEVLALQALARRRRGDQADALALLERSLHLAEPEGYVRLFIDLGLPMASLLQECRARHVMLEYVSELLDAFGPLAGRLAPGISSLPAPLTDRELEILTLLAAGLSNKEIGEKLYISPQTVKKHTGNIYGKLDVRGRTAAVARARDLDLLR